MNRLLGQLLQGPAVAVRIAEGGVQDATEILDLADPHPPLDEPRTRRLYVWDDQVEALNGAGRRVHDPDPEGDRAGRTRGVS